MDRTSRRRSIIRSFVAAGLCALALSVSSCVSAASALPPERLREQPPERLSLPDSALLILGRGRASEARLLEFFLAGNREVDPARASVLVGLYVEEASLEGVNPDIAFVQMCLETGFLRFGNLVTEDMHNYCGLGSIGPGQPGLSFPDARTGVRAHVQHLKAYGSAEPLRGELVDPRYRYVNPKGKSPTIHGLGGTWAADREYGSKLQRLLERLYGIRA